MWRLRTIYDSSHDVCLAAHSKRDVSSKSYIIGYMNKKQCVYTDVMTIVTETKPYIK